MKTVTLPSASEVKKTKAAEKEATKKRKASTSAESSAPKKVRTLPSSSHEPIDATPISSVPSYEIVLFGEEYVIPEDDEETQSAASSE